MDYENLAGPQGASDNIGGTTQRCYFAPISSFASIKKPIAVPVNPEDEVDIITAHTFNTGGCFLKAYITRNKGELKTEPVGESDGRGFKQTFKFFYPGNESAAHAFAAQAKNDKFIFLIEKPDSDVNGYLQVGTEMFPAELTGNFTTATNESGVQGYEFEAVAITNKQFMYKAAVSLTPAP